ncbi:MAG: Gfo/Idh/MocA family oxidoreductase [Spirochaetia bacterium]|nr:Gfo/Idh/MocA family oxidoreductase [Spirochaetia bacterium]
MLQLGIVGTGAMAEYQVKKFRELDGCRICACADRNPGKAEDFSSRFDIPGYYTSITDLLDDGKCQAVSCVTSDSQHPRIVMAAMERGLPVFCEKPLARTLHECQAMANLAATAGVPNLVNYSKRNAPALAALKTILDSGKLGEIQEVEAEYLQSWVRTKVWGDWLTTPRWRWRLLPEESSGGVAGDLGSHLVDALLYLFGELVPTGQASAVNLAQAMSAGNRHEPIPAEFLSGSGPVCVAFSATAVLSGGAPVKLRVSWVEDGAVDDFRIHVCGSKGRAVLDLGRSRSAVAVYNESASDDAGGTVTMVEGPRIPSTYQRFMDLASGLRPMGPGGEDGLDFAQALRTMQLLDSLVPGGLPR